MHGASIRLLQEQAWLSVRAGEVRRTPGDSSLPRGLRLKGRRVWTVVEVMREGCIHCVW